jgi:replication factor A1
MTTWSNARGQGNLFSVVLKDKAGSEIRGTFFKAEADKWFPILELDKVYTITGGRVKTANQKFSSVQNDYEISFDSNTRFDEVVDDGQIGGRNYKFIPSLRDVQSQKENSMIDVVAVVKEVEEAVDMTTKRGQTRRRRIFLCDSSAVQVEMTLWDQDADRFPVEACGRVIQIKDARVSDFHGKQLSSTTGTTIDFKATSKRAQELHQWWSGGGDQQLFESISTSGAETSNVMAYLAAINERRLGTKKDVGDYFAFYGLVSDVMIGQGRLLYYNACPNTACKNRKVEENGGTMVCKTCGAQVSAPRERFAFTFRAADFTGSGLVSALGDDTIGQPILGYGAYEWAEATRNEDAEASKRRIKDSRFADFKIKVRVKADEYNGELRPKMTAVAVTPINYAEAAKFFAAEINKY